MHYAIIVNPVAGPLNIDQKRTRLAQAAALLKAPIVGLDTTSAGDFRQCAREAAAHCDVLVVAGGDGTLSQIINTVDTSRQTIAYLPLGSGNAMGHALKYSGDAADIAGRIKDARVSAYDLIQCGGQQRAFMASVGIDGQIIRLRDQYLQQGLTGMQAYIRAISRAYRGSYQPYKARMAIDGHEYQVVRVLSLIVTKQPYFGYGMNVAPQARMGDGRLHIICIRSSPWRLLMAWATALTIGNRAGRYFNGGTLRIRLDHPSILQMDGDADGDGDAFDFNVLPGALRIKG